MDMELVCGHGFRQVETLQLLIPPGSTVLQALEEALQKGWRLSLDEDEGGIHAQSPFTLEHPRAHWQDKLENGKLFLSIWGEPCTLDSVLEPQDRLEVTKSIRVDPKVARRERFKLQGAKAAGLFAKKRAGAKAGY
jgi:hypothetical protein